MTMTKKRGARMGAAVAVAALGAWAGRKIFHRAPPDVGRPVAVRRGEIEDVVEATGSVAPLNRVEIKSPVSGRVERLLVDEGDRVKAGQIIAWMSSTDRAAILDAARSQGPEELKKWEDTYKATPIIAPLPGLIILRNVVEGQTVDPTMVLYAMSDTLIVLAEVDESDIGKIHMGMPARVTLDAYPDRHVEGAVFDILYEGKNISNVIQYGVKIKFPQVPAYFRSQMTANIDFVVRRKADALLVPAAAVKDVPGGGKQVSVLGADGNPESKPVQTGVESGTDVEILSGLSEGDQVLLKRGKYVPQQGPQSSPLTFGGRPGGSSPSGQAPKPKKS